MKKICPRCEDKIIDYKDKYCPECTIIMDKHKQDTRKQYNKEIRQGKDKKYTDFYISKEWINTSNIVRNKYHGLCLMCLLKDNIVNVCDVVHHIIEIRTPTGWTYRLDISNLIPLCHRHHNELHGNYTNYKQDILKQLIIEYKSIYLSENLK